MVSMHSGFEGTNQKDSPEKLTEKMNSKAEDMSWLIDNLPVTVFRASSKLSWGIDYISKSVEKLTGYSKMDFIDQKISWTDIVFPEDISIIDKAVQKAKKSKTSYQVEYRIKKSDGSTVLIQEQAHLVCDEKGDLAYRDGIFLDSTSQIKRKEDSHKALKEDEKIQLEMLRSFVERISKGEKLEKISENFTGELRKPLI
jgi:methyl-accepting chemotaxis protein